MNDDWDWLIIYLLTAMSALSFIVSLVALLVRILPGR